MCWLLFSTNASLVICRHSHQSQRGFKGTAGRGSMDDFRASQQIVFAVFQKSEIWWLHPKVGKGCHLDCVCYIFFIEGFPSLNSWHLSKMCLDWISDHLNSISNDNGELFIGIQIFMTHIWVNTTGCRSDFFSVFNIILYAWRVFWNDVYQNAQSGYLKWENTRGNFILGG